MVEMNAEQILNQLRKSSNPERIKQQKRAGIDTSKAIGLNIPFIRDLAKKIGKNHNLALKLYEYDYNESRMLASLIDEPKMVTEEQMDEWASYFNSWDVVDTVVSNLFENTPYAVKKSLEWKDSKEEYVKRAGFVLMARMAVGKKEYSNKEIESMLTYIFEASNDDRNMVKKAVNWALRQIGKKNLYLNEKAIEMAEKILKLDSKTAKWIATDALRELKSEKVQYRLKQREKK